MPFHVIKGTFHLTGYTPNGDSIRFAADDPDLWDLLAGPRPTVNARGHVPLRLEGIDTLETHFQHVHQPLLLATAALDYLTKALGITNVQWNAGGTVVTSANDDVTGYILSRMVDKHHRPIVFAFSGSPPEADGAAVFLNTHRLQHSVNCALLRAGLAYPMYYKGLFPDLRNMLTTTTHEARHAGRGLWPQDMTNRGFAVAGLQSVTDKHVMFPQLFRHLAVYLEAEGSVCEFKEYLAALGEEILILSSCHVTHLDTVIDVKGKTVRMTELPENLVFLET